MLAHSPKVALFATLVLYLPLQTRAADLQSAHSALPANRPVVVLLHGLARSSSSMKRLAIALEKDGYRICNIDYPSRKHGIPDLAAKFVAPAIARCRSDASAPLNFVTHSMGGIIVRQLASSNLVMNVGRVVMLGPPNRGSELADAMGDWALFRFINGPAGGELGTSQNALPKQLGAAQFQVGVVAGRLSINWINSLIIPGADDGKVSLASAQLDGMQDYVVVRATHPFLMKDGEAIAQVLAFLRSGCFIHDSGGNAAAMEGPCSTSTRTQQAGAIVDALPYVAQQ